MIKKIMCTLLFCSITGCSTIPVNVNNAADNEEKGLPTWAWWAIGLAVVAATVDTSPTEECLFVTDSQGHIIPGGCDR
jgi:hypothetical protein